MTNKLVVTIAIVALIAQCVYGLPAPQFLSFQDGKVGVGFGGYHAEAGLGGFLGGNKGSGGLFASAGTPNGQHAGAGLGGILDGNARTSGGAFAGASAGHGVGASAAIGGGLDSEGGAGGSGAEAHAGGISKKVVKLGQTDVGETIYTHEVPPPPQTVNTRFSHDYESNTKTKEVVKEVHTDLEAPPAVPHPIHTHRKTIYKKKVITRPHKVAHVETTINRVSPGSTNFDLNRFFDFQAFTNLASSYSYPQSHRPSTVEQTHHHYSGTYQKDASNGPTGGSTSAGPSRNPNFWNDIFNIPISTLNAVNQFLNGKGGNAAENAQKTT